MLGFLLRVYFVSSFVQHVSLFAHSFDVRCVFWFAGLVRGVCRHFLALPSVRFFLFWLCLTVNFGFEIPKIALYDACDVSALHCVGGESLADTPFESCTFLLHAVASTKVPSQNWCVVTQHTFFKCPLYSFHQNAFA